MEYLIGVSGSDTAARLFMPSVVPPPSTSNMAVNHTVRRQPVLELNTELQPDDSDDEDNGLHVTPPPVSPPSSPAHRGIQRRPPLFPRGSEQEIAAAAQAAMAASDVLGPDEQQVLVTYFFTCAQFRKLILALAIICRMQILIVRIQFFLQKYLIYLKFRQF